MTIRSTAVPAAAAAALLAAGIAAPAAASDTRVALVPGGPHPYFAAWEQAAADAAEAFDLAGADYKVPSAWELSLQNEMIESSVAQGFNAFGIFPGDAVGTGNMMNELSDFDVPAVALAGCTEDPSAALFCLGTDVYESAYQGTTELIEAMGGTGEIAHFTGFLVDPNTRLRIQAVEDAIADSGTEVELLQTIADIDAPEPADEKINALLAAQGDAIDGIITTAWVPSVVAATSLRNLGDQRIVMVGIDHDEVVLDAIRDGFVRGTMLQNPYGQGYIGAYALDRVRQGCSVKADAPFQETAQTAKFIDSGTAFVGADQVDDYQQAMIDVTDAIMADFEATYLDCP